MPDVCFEQTEILHCQISWEQSEWQNAVLIFYCHQFGLAAEKGNVEFYIRKGMHQSNMQILCSGISQLIGIVQ